MKDKCLLQVFFYLIIFILFFKFQNAQTASFCLYFYLPNCRLRPFTIKITVQQIIEHRFTFSIKYILNLFTIYHIQFQFHWIFIFTIDSNFKSVVVCISFFGYISISLLV